MQVMLRFGIISIHIIVLQRVYSQQHIKQNCRHEVDFGQDSTSLVQAQDKHGPCQTIQADTVALTLNLTTSLPDPLERRISVPE